MFGELLRFGVGVGLVDFGRVGAEVAGVVTRSGWPRLRRLGSWASYSPSLLRIEQRLPSRGDLVEDTLARLRVRAELVAADMRRLPDRGVFDDIQVLFRGRDSEQHVVGDGPLLAGMPSHLW